ncbi:uncharacterized protein LOC130770967 [Actinidia eriantha]|uniref:uncharacterized protein LOC130770967 n=1 Tax=Actinidia eriantha TaxID=165200 RepID=UPI00258CF872|nr:uncharacterized protein LOC130770967 [Actinidia eriantha]
MNFDSSNIAPLNGDNYADWKEKVLLALGCMDLDLALRVDESPKPTELKYSWIHPDCAKAKEYLKTIQDQFETSDKALASILMTNMCSMKLNGTKDVREHIMQMRDITATKIIGD